ncbi:MAG: UDP-N-acetylmuramoyl-L-alanine--D-glutamate ligase [Clostridia bacterium]|nr:UDP-N-acetylmuramoyl-L-alanine--D-glutamate ligase [Clostridia bacterium]MDD4375234.1 UDP-N-acetylmuramoyl-L-alanine--D-glutamate ligase [Clostridia bacterium]
MKQGIISELKGKKILILGFGKEGRSTYEFIKNNVEASEIIITDKNTINEQRVLEAEGTKVYTGNDYLDLMSEVEIVIKSPGISLRGINIENFKHKITSQTELFLKYYKSKTIGVTGTVGKSTTTSLIYHILKKAKLDAKLVGNIGTPVFDMLKNVDADYYIYELSSHQLQYINVSPHIAVLLNIFEEHLDYYSNYSEYIEAKQNIYLNSNKNDYLIYNYDMKESMIEGTPICNLLGVSNNIFDDEVSVTEKDGTINYKLLDKEGTLKYNVEKINIEGKHNRFNIMVAATICKLINVDEQSIIKGIETFKGLNNRLENIGTYKGVRYINDSISTVPEATISAIDSIKGVQTVLIGGMDRGVNYDKLIGYINDGKIKNVILMYDSGKKIYEKIYKKGDKFNVYYAEGLEEAVKKAVEVTSKGKTCILSPASASFGFFKNFEERGGKFKEYVIKYNK